MDIRTLSYVIDQIALIDKPSISGDDLKRYVSNLRNNLEFEIENTLEMMYREDEAQLDLMERYPEAEAMIEVLKKDYL
jgi:hypothetical protein